jgi:hypothetical protein
MLQLVLNLVLKPLKSLTKTLNSKYGILLDNKILDQLQDLIIEVQ